MKAFFINGRLAFGSKVNKQRHVEKLRALGITHVVDLPGYHSKKLREFNTVWLGFKDNAKPRPRWFYGRALSFHEQAMSQPQIKVFVMCRAGKRRSPSLTYFLLRASGISPRKAQATVRRARPCAMAACTGEPYVSPPCRSPKMFFQYCVSHPAKAIS